MKKNFNSRSFLFLLLVFLLSFCNTRATRLLHPKQENGFALIPAGNAEVKVNGSSQEGHLREIEDDSQCQKLRGVENCENGDDECMERRMLSDAHLDYIYTQHHKP